jgi:hypothetical protein
MIIFIGDQSSLDWPASTHNEVQIIPITQRSPYPRSSHIGLSVTDLDAVKFYTEVMGWKIRHARHRNHFRR